MSEKDIHSLIESDLEKAFTDEEIIERVSKTLSCYECKVSYILHKLRIHNQAFFKINDARVRLKQQIKLYNSYVDQMTQFFISKGDIVLIASDAQKAKEDPRIS